MKSYLRRFRHVRGWYCDELFENARIKYQLAETLTSFFDLRIIYWLKVELNGVACSRRNALYRTPGLTFSSFFLNDGSTIELSCNSQNQYDKTLVLHPNVHKRTKVYTRSQPHYEYRLVPQYV